MELDRCSAVRGVSFLAENLSAAPEPMSGHSSGFMSACACVCVHMHDTHTLKNRNKSFLLTKEMT